jgi:hypothetical protein
MSGMRIAVVLLALAGEKMIARGQGPGLPATPPTASVAPRILPREMSVEGVASPAKVVYSGGQLQVTAKNSSLNQILRAIERQTGMKIAGGVADERVYGKYGPASTAEVLAALLEGTGSNMLLRETGKDSLLDLILTPRNGGLTPLSPDLAGVDDPKADEPPARMVAAPASSSDAAAPAVVPQPAATAPVAPAPVTPAGGAVGGPAGMQAAAPASAPEANAPAHDAGDAATASPNGVKTPQQIYQQLMQLQQQQPQQNPK